MVGDRPFPEASVCPGYTTRLPEVAEAQRARSWGSRGGLLPLYGARQLPPVALEAIDVLENAVNLVEARRWRERQQEARDRQGG